MSPSPHGQGLESHLSNWVRGLTQGQPSYHHPPLSQSATSDDEMAEDDNELLKKSASSSLPSFQQRRGRLSSGCLILLAMLLSALVSAGLTITISHFRINQPQPSASEPRIGQDDLIAPFRPTPRLRHCGTNAEEARMLGCKFQIWSYSWVPPECFDKQLVDEWLAMRDWEYYDDRGTRGNVVNFTTEVLYGEGDQTLYSTWGQHYWHCAFTWRKFLRAALGSGVGITDQDLDYHHANHCQDTIRNKPDYRPWGENDIELVVGYHKC